MKVCFKRFLAFYIDLIIATAIAFVFSTLLDVFPAREKTVNVITVLLIMCVGMVIFLLKDISGRSLGKRIFLQKIVDREQPSRKISMKKLILRNILAGLWVVDAFLLYEGISQYKIMDKALGLDVVLEGESAAVLRDRLTRTLK